MQTVSWLSNVHNDHQRLAQFCILATPVRQYTFTLAAGSSAKMDCVRVPAVKKIGDTQLCLQQRRPLVKYITPIITRSFIHYARLHLEKHGALPSQGVNRKSTLQVQYLQDFQLAAVSPVGPQIDYFITQDQYGLLSRAPSCRRKARQQRSKRAFEHSGHISQQGCGALQLCSPT